VENAEKLESGNEGSARGVPSMVDSVAEITGINEQAMQMNVLLYGRTTIHRGTGPDTYTQHLIGALSDHCRLGEYRESAMDWGQWDLLHVLDMKHAPLDLLKSASIPIVIDVHDTYWLEPVTYRCSDRWARMWLNWRRRRKYPKLLAKASAIIVHSQFVSDVMRNYLPEFLKQKVNVVPYAVSISNIAKDRTTPHSPRILYVGRDFFRKGVPTLVDALELLLSRIPDIQLGVVGREYWHSQRWALRRCKGLPVTFLGGLSPQEMHQEIRNSDLLVLPSYTEAFGMVLLEAQALGIPVIGSDTGGIPETMDIGKSGLITPVGNAEALALAIEKLLDDPNQRQKMGHHGAAWVRDHFSPKVMRETLMEVYQSTH
jgi:glycosyltransferase involved in cell wall biosynthesis